MSQIDLLDIDIEQSDDSIDFYNNTSHIDLNPIDLSCEQSQEILSELNKPQRLQRFQLDDDDSSSNLRTSDVQLEPNQKN
jgi:hypothetical protein